MAADAVERKVPGQALRESKSKYRFLFENMPDGFAYHKVVFGEQGKPVDYIYLEVNDAFEKMTGLKKENVVGRKVTQVIPGIEHDKAGWIEIYGRVTLTGEPVRFENYSETLKRWFAVTAYSPGSPYFATVFEDVTERKQTEESLQQVRVDLERAQEVGRIGWWRLDTQRNVLTWSDENHRIFGIPKGSPLNYETFLQTIHPDDRQDVDSKWNAAQRGEPYDIEHRIMVGAQVRWVREKAYLEFDATGNLRGGFGITHDISDRKRAEEALARAVTQLETLLVTAPVGFCHLDRDLRFLMINDRLAETNGLPVAAHLGKTVGEVLPSLLPAVQEVTARILATGEAVVGQEFSGETPLQPGVTRYWSENWYPVREGGHVTGFGVVVEEITDRKRAEEALRNAHAELEERVQERTSELSEVIRRLRAENVLRERLEKTLRESETQVRFFASQCLTAQETERKRVAGELHDSIAASIAAVRLRIERMAEANQRDLGSTDSLQEIASTVAEINVEVRRIMTDLRPSVLDDLGILPALNWFCREYQKTYSHISVEKQVGIEERDVPDSIKTPIFRISQEAMNNVAKHSRASLVHLSLQKEGERILLTIQDNGQGFDPQAVRKGMGLSSIRERAELSGGVFEVQSGIGEGTTVRVWLPIRVGSVA